MSCRALDASLRAEGLSTGFCCYLGAPGIVDSGATYRCLMRCHYHVHLGLLEVVLERDILLALLRWRKEVVGRGFAGFSVVLMCLLACPRRLFIAASWCMPLCS